MTSSMGSQPAMLLRCDGSPAVGMGHVVRSVAVATELREHFDCRVVFALREGQDGISYIRARGFDVMEAGSVLGARDYGAWLEHCLEAIRAQALILDARDNPPPEALEKFRSSGVPVVAIDDPTDSRLHADLVFYPPIPQVKEWPWDNFYGDLKVGWKWIPLRRQFRSHGPRAQKSLPRLMVTMGGSDARGMTVKVLESLVRLELPLEVLVVLGRAFRFQPDFSRFLSRFPHPVSVNLDVGNMARLMERVDLAVASFGQTAYELAAMGVPSIFMCLSEDHQKSAVLFEREGLAQVMGLMDDFDSDALIENVRRLLADAKARSAMSSKGPQLVDGMGSLRIANEIVRLCCPLRTPAAKKQAPQPYKFDGQDAASRPPGLTGKSVESES